ncbi:HAD-IA family hydrolase [Tropicibacter naphthalenivorans]|uniref:Phosphoglycolate phosphatase n=1 Tax=Tropicibacter naphthalenivorans TaxID=441103 RepID=A0A0P1GT25_9RHOB|nr:HAD-IA family hydrolase [Tropicibacter naphthalenivorans]CUH78815.1 Phosphoglycolate phosphatase [Tropicibacter naphthalenivorans]SMC81653.1 phosphoglycolate phosphatase [Tropicibacter naphthalenivorans]
MTLKLAIFDVDGTLVDSQGDILASMTAAFEAVGLPAPDRATVLSIVGLSLPLAVAELAPEVDAAGQARMTQTYKDTYAQLRISGGASPLYPGIAEMLDRLARIDDLLLGVATGKSRRGLTALLGSLDLNARFVTTQVADDHPSKPHPSMIHAALSEAGVDAADAVMIGDTRFDMEMAQAAGVRGIGVAWGYHAADTLTGAVAVAQDASALETMILKTLGGLS